MDGSVLILPCKETDLTIWEESAKCQQGCGLYLHSPCITRSRSIKQYRDESVIQACRRATYKFLEIM